MIILRFLFIPLPVAAVLFILQIKWYFGLDFLGLLVAAPAYYLAEQAPSGLGIVSGENSNFINSGMLGVALLGWSSMALCPWWVPARNERALGDRLMIVFLPLCAVLHLLAIGWYIWHWLDH